MPRDLLVPVLLANGLCFWPRRQYREEACKGLPKTFSGWVLSASGLLAVLSLFLVFDSVEQNEPLLQVELNGLYGALLLFGLSVTVAWTMFFGKSIR